MTFAPTPSAALIDTVFALLAVRGPGTVLPPLTLNQSVAELTMLASTVEGRTVQTWLNLRPLAVQLQTAQMGLGAEGPHVWQAPFDLEWATVGQGPQSGSSASPRRTLYDQGLAEIAALTGALPRRIALPAGHPAGSFYDLDMATGAPLATQDESGLLAILPSLEAATWRLTATFVAASPLRAAP